MKQWCFLTNKTLRTLAVGIFILFGACRQDDPRYAGGPFYDGLPPLSWGSRLSALDSLMMVDTSIFLISRMPNSKTRGFTNLIRKHGQEIYLDYNDRNELGALHYIAVDTMSAVDSLRSRMQHHYGEPVFMVKPNYRKEEWNIPHRSSNVMIRLIVTSGQYSVSATHRQYLQF